MGNWELSAMDTQNKTEKRRKETRVEKENEKMERKMNRESCGFEFEREREEELKREWEVMMKLESPCSIDWT